MSGWKGKSRGSLLGYKIFYTVLKWFGLRPAYGLLSIISLYYLLFTADARSHILAFYKQVFNWTCLKGWEACRKNFYFLGQSLIDKFAIFSGMKNKFSYHFDGIQHLEKMAKESGGILIGAHLGNWDVAGNFLNDINTPFNIVMYEGEVEQIKNFQDEKMQDRKVNIIQIAQDLSHVFKISAAIHKKEFICFHGDRFLEGSKFTEAMFFGKKAKFAHGPFQIACKFKVPVSFVYAIREPGFHYHLYASEPFVPTDGIDALVSRYISQLEEKVKKYPYQWFNYYAFWGTQEE